ncbi:hypothetical protein [Arenicella xantha]|uniref:Uncharacterized protein n=1 Tax=Arenicella xantha TaxID=644221 RepID=A0A395JFI5_9GAMM|nr:hypothetical protein [Arenicella xantha]RBP47036.1 hypothetical protein DFR28_11110 [Arenicella xantha]
MTDIAFESPERYLQSLREKWLLSEEVESALKGNQISHSSKFTIDSKTWNQEIYSDSSSTKKFVIFEVSRKNILGREHHCLGCEIIEGKYSLVTNEQLWKEGIP